MDQEPDSWVKAPAFQWTPETPLRVDPQFTDALTANAEVAEPRFENPLLREDAPRREPVTAAAETPRPRFVPAAEAETKSPPLFLPRMAVGLSQGVLLLALFTAREALNPYVFSAGLMALLFVPLVLLAGLGRMPRKLLLGWALFAGGVVAAAGAYHHWRTLSSDGGHPGLALLALTALFLFIGQALAQARAGDYPAHVRAAWRLAIRIVLCALVAGLAWAAAGAASGLMREHYPALQFSVFVIPLVALSAALAAQLTGEKFLGALQEGLVFVFTMALPFVLLLAIAVVGLSAFGTWQPSLAVAAILGAALIACINASYRDGASWRPYWRRRAEFAGALVLMPLTLIAGFALAARVQQYGWTDNRVFAVAGLLLMFGYALCYAASALVSLGGGGWMQRIEGANLALAFASLVLIAALTSPIADPARLAVASQSFRLEQRLVTADAFDFTWLRDGGLRFGHEALAKMAAAKDNPVVAHGAFVALTVPPLAERPTPTEIGANIHVHSQQGLPSGLLARDWSGVAGAPPCLINASLTCDAFFTDLDGDGRDEIILAYGNDTRWWASLMKQGAGEHGNSNGGWYVAGTLAGPPCPGGLAALRAGQFTMVRPAGNWRDLLVGGIRLSINRPKAPSACPLS